MMKSNVLRNITFCTLATVACTAGQAAFAHTGVKDAATEGKSLYTAFTITHGCQDTAEGEANPVEKLLPVTAQTAVFPNSSDSEAYKIDPVTGEETPINLADYIEGAVGGLPTLSPGMVQDRNVFKKQFETTDGGEKVRGQTFLQGKLDTTAVGIVPFRLTAPKFIAGTCAKSLLVRIGVANYCSKSKNTSQKNRADIWIGHMTDLFNDPGVMPHDFETDPFWPTLTVNRTTALPSEASCPGGKYFDIAVQPSDADIDKYLPIKGYWPAK